MWMDAWIDEAGKIQLTQSSDMYCLDRVSFEQPSVDVLKAVIKTYVFYLSTCCIFDLHCCM